ncbi:hypothetical protein [Cellulomonas sp. HZM]|uniref:hypothetical protein n=1 Tax=Cellulomonas sp. HZM TaxID=1454010 RepID=UPI00055167A4|nr:hypothetical protein [Cellulomonas sp. HZM]
MPVVVAALVGLLLAASVAAVLYPRPAPVVARDVAWIAGSTDVRTQEGAVYASYLRRHRLHRLVGGLVGVSVAVVVGLSTYQTVGFSIGERNPLGDVLFLGIAGVVVGSLSAETYRIARPSGRLRASLEPHRPAARPGVVRAARVCASLAAALGAADLLLGEATAPTATALVLGALVVGVSELTLRAVRTRPRPGLSGRAAVVDDRIRAFASTVVAWLELSIALLVLAWATSALPADGSGAVGSALTVVEVALVVAAFVALHRASPRPSRRWDAGAPSATADVMRDAR